MPTADPATVVAALHAFSKDPLRHRHRYTHGHEPFPGGLTVFQLAQGRFPQGLLRDLSQAERERIRQSAATLIRQVCFWDGATHYQVLCVPPDARKEAIKDHYRAMIALIHPDRQDRDSPHWPPEAAQRVNRAYEVLSDDAARKDYDAALARAVARPAPDIGTLDFPEPVVVEKDSTRRRFSRVWRKVRQHALPLLLALALLFYLQSWWAVEMSEKSPGPEWVAGAEQYYRWTRNLFSETTPRLVEPRPVQRAQPATPEAVPLTLPERRPPAPAIPDRAPGAPRATVPAPTQAAPSAEKLAAAAAAMKRTQVDMEVLVVRLVTFYEDGNTEKLLGLLDERRLSANDRLRLRSTFDAFFRETKSRRLMVEWIRWDEPELGRFRASGQARLRAEYAGREGGIDRVIPLELRAEASADEAKITRLALYPYE